MENVSMDELEMEVARFEALKPESSTDFVLCAGEAPLTYCGLAVEYSEVQNPEIQDRMPEDEVGTQLEVPRKARNSPLQFA